MNSFRAKNEDQRYSSLSASTDAATDKILDDYINKLAKDKYEGTDYLADAKKVMHDDLNNDDDPFEDYGFGIIAYFKLLRTLIYIYIAISAIAAYMCYKYTFGNALEGDGQNTTN